MKIQVLSEGNVLNSRGVIPLKLQAMKMDLGFKGMKKKVEEEEEEEGRRREEKGKGDTIDNIWTQILRYLI